jgi:ATP-dependent RNA helicase SUPV3L1/SUV3
VCGERAVRVDILERLADLIRPALAWREGTNGQKPPGAIAGGGFTVVNTMTSLIGASGEDFASILRSLGYRVEQRPKPVEPPEPAAAAPAADSEALREEASAPAEGIAGAAEASSESPPSSETTPSGEEAGASREAAEVSGVAETPAESITHAGAPASIINSEVSASASHEPADSASVPDANAVVVPETGSIAAAPVTEPELIEVWRPSRSDGRRRPRAEHRHPRHGSGGTRGPRRHAAPVEAASPEANSPPSAAAAENQQPAEAEQNAGDAPRVPRRRDRRRHGADQRSDSQRQERHERQSAHAARYDRHRQDRHETREKTADPNSPFAKLAALKAQLEAEAKERR